MDDRIENLMDAGVIDPAKVGGLGVRARVRGGGCSKEA